MSATIMVASSLVPGDVCYYVDATRVLGYVRRECGDYCDCKPDPPESPIARHTCQPKAEYPDVKFCIPVPKLPVASSVSSKKGSGSGGSKKGGGSSTGGGSKVEPLPKIKTKKARQEAFDSEWLYEEALDNLREAQRDFKMAKRLVQEK